MEPSGIKWLILSARSSAFTHVTIRTPPLYSTLRFSHLALRHLPFFHLKVSSGVYKNKKSEDVRISTVSHDTRGGLANSHTHTHGLKGCVLYVHTHSLGGRQMACGGSLYSRSCRRRIPFDLLPPPLLLRSGASTKDSLFRFSYTYICVAGVFGGIQMHHFDRASRRSVTIQS